MDEWCKNLNIDEGRKKNACIGEAASENKKDDGGGYFVKGDNYSLWTIDLQTKKSPTSRIPIDSKLSLAWSYHGSEY